MAKFKSIDAPALYVEGTGNAKTGRGSDVTYASIEATCPRECPLRGEGCYAETGMVGIHERRLKAQGVTSTMAARYEARAIDDSYGGGDVPEGRVLRLHVSGDARTGQAAKTLAQAALRWLCRGGRAVWTYTHAWRHVARGAWGEVSVLASVEAPGDGVKALRRGYAPARVVAAHPDDGRAYVEAGVKWIPCPAQTRDDVTCVSCGLCFDADALASRGAGIAFAVHGQRSRRALAVIQERGAS